MNETYHLSSWGIAHKPEAVERNNNVHGIFRLIFLLSDIDYFYSVYTNGNNTKIVKKYPSENTSIDKHQNFIFAGDERVVIEYITEET